MFFHQFAIRSWFPGGKFLFGEILPHTLAAHQETEVPGEGNSIHQHLLVFLYKFLVSFIGKEKVSATFLFVFLPSVCCLLEYSKRINDRVRLSTFASYRVKVW